MVKFIIWLPIALMS